MEWAGRLRLHDLCRRVSELPRTKCGSAPGPGALQGAGLGGEGGRRLRHGWRPLQANTAAAQTEDLRGAGGAGPPAGGLLQLREAQ